MGGLFSYLKNSDKRRAQHESDFDKTMDDAQKQIDDFNKAYSENMAAREQLIAQIAAEREEIVQQQINEVLYFEKRYKELKQRQEYINNLSTTFLCLVMTNYPINQVYDISNISTLKTNFDRTYDSIFPSENEDIAKDVFYTLCCCSPLLPLLYPTGQADNSVHDYTVSSTQQIDTFDFRTKLDGYLLGYIHGNLKKYVYNVVVSNCFDYMYAPNKNELDMLKVKCEQLISDVKSVKTTDYLISMFYDWIAGFDDVRYMMRIKMLSAKSHKGVCKNTVKLVPQYYPKVCPQYELFEAILMMTNTIFYNYGKIQQGVQLISASATAPPSSAPNDATEGGLCFTLPEDYIKNWYKQYYDFNKQHIWDLETYVMLDATATQHEVSAELITEMDDPSIWMTDLKVDKTVTVINVAPDTQIGYLQYNNPTHRYTYQLFIDNIVPQESFSIPKIGASKNANFQINMIYNLYHSLFETSDIPNALTHSTNVGLFYSFDYLTVTPPGQLVQFGHMSTTAAFMYQSVLADAMEYYFVFPIDITMTMSKINQLIWDTLKLSGDKDYGTLPQAIWCGSSSTFIEHQAQSVPALKSGEGTGTTLDSRFLPKTKYTAYEADIVDTETMTFDTDAGYVATLATGTASSASTTDASSTNDTNSNTTNTNNINNFVVKTKKDKQCLFDLK